VALSVAQVSAQNQGAAGGDMKARRKPEAPGMFIRHIQSLLPIFIIGFGGTFDVPREQPASRKALTQANK